MPKRRAIADLIYIPGEPLVLSLLFEDGDHERIELSAGSLRTLARGAVHALTQPILFRTEGDPK